MKLKPIRWLYDVTGRKKLNILWMILLQSVNGASGVLYALLLRNIVDSAMEGSKNSFISNALLLVLLVAAQITIRAVIRWLEEHTRSDFENLLKKRLFSCILKKDHSAVSAVHSGEWLNRLTNDTMIVANNCVDILPGASGMLIKMLSAAAMLLVLDSRLSVVMIPAGIILIFTTYGFRKILKQLHKNVQESDGKLRICFQEQISSLMMIRSFAAEIQSAEEADSMMLSHKAARMKKNRFSNLCNIGFQLCMHGMYIAGIIYCGYGILIGTISYGTLTAVTQLIAQIQSPFANITGYLPKFYAMTASAERLMEVQSLEDDLADNNLPIDDILREYNSTFAGIGLQNASFTYYPACDDLSVLSKENMPQVVKNISVNIYKGQYVAFTGHSGCGKSTVLKLLTSVYRLDEGSRIIMNTDGTVKTLDQAYHRLFAYVPQGNQLMSGTIREIISFADRDASNDSERLNEALRIACADEFVSDLENGIDTILGERGTGLSEGQMQRIAVARAIFSGSPVLLLDEATSALDQATEMKMLENLRNMTDKTVVIVTHRSAALGICDRVVEFTENGVVEKNG